MKKTTILITLLIIITLLHGCLSYDVQSLNYYHAEFLPNGNIVACKAIVEGQSGIGMYLSGEHYRSELVEIEWLSALKDDGTLDLSHIHEKVIKELPVVEFDLSPDGKYIATEHTIWTYPGIEKVCELPTFNETQYVFDQWSPDSNHCLIHIPKWELVDFYLNIFTVSNNEVVRYGTRARPVDYINQSTIMFWEPWTLKTMKFKDFQCNYLDLNTGKITPADLIYPIIGYAGEHKLFIKYYEKGSEATNEDRDYAPAIYDTVEKKVVRGPWKERVSCMKLSYFNFNGREFILDPDSEGIGLSEISNNTFYMLICMGLPKNNK